MMLVYGEILALDNGISFIQISSKVAQREKVKMACIRVKER